MRHASLTQRRLYMHPAHAVVGVSSPSTVFRSMRPRDPSLADKNLRPLTVSLVCGELDGRSAIRLLQCQRLFQGCLNAECQYSFVDLAEGLSQVASVAPADCTVLLYQGITILPADGDWEPELLAAGYAGACDWEPAEITVVPADVRHPLLSGVGPFSSRSGMPAEACVTSDGVGLLLGEKGGSVGPWPGPGSRPATVSFTPPLAEPTTFANPTSATF